MFKNKLADVFGKLPDFSIFGGEECRRIQKGWEEVFGKSVLEANASLKNPLNFYLKVMKVSYQLGGFFQIKRVKWAECGLMFMDYDILIESVAN